MEIEIHLTNAPVAELIPPPAVGLAGAWVEFRGLVLREENGQQITALEFEVERDQAEREIRRMLVEISGKHPCLAAKVVHRLGLVPVGQTALYVGVAAKHRDAALTLLAEFLDQFKPAPPIWKRRIVAAAPAAARAVNRPHPQPESETAFLVVGKSLAEAMAEIAARIQPLPPVRVSLEAAAGRVLHEMACAPKDLPSCDRSTRDGYALLEFDLAETFRIVDTIHPADWKPRQLQPGEAVRVFTGAALPCGSLRVVMQENVERSSHTLRILKHEATLNLRRRGEDVKAGELLVASGVRLDAGKLALLSSAGGAQSLVSPRLRVAHVTTADQVPAPGQAPEPGSVSESQALLIRSLLQRWACDWLPLHLPENFILAQGELESRRAEIEAADVVLISGGTGGGENNFTRQLLAWLDYEIAFTQVNVRPGRPLVFAVKGAKAAFGLPGNPLSHFASFHFAVATALARLSGEEPPKFLRGRLAVPLTAAASPRETLWPAKNAMSGGELRLHPLPWASAGEVASFAEANALIRVPAHSPPLATGMVVEFLPANH